MKDPESVTIIDVTADNVEQLTPVIFQALESSDFIAIDQELSGLGNTAGRCRLDMKSYYTRLREAAETRQVVSIGLSCFRSSTNFTKLHPESCDPLVFTCTSFNILLFPDAEFEMDGSAKRFLVTHGFDLNRWVDAGIRYSLHGQHNDFMSSLVQKLLISKAMLVFHNGLTDLAYFYSSFYNPLPKNNESFTADIADMFADRLFDTKVICNKVLGWRMHALEYCYKKAQRVTERSSFQGKPAVILQEKEAPVTPSDLKMIPFAIRRTQFLEAPEIGRDVCQLVYHFGYCNAFKTGACKHSVEQHQMDLVLDVEEQRSVIEEVHEVSQGQNPIKNATFCPKNSTSEVSQERKEQDRQESDSFRQSLVRSPAKPVGPENKTGDSPIPPDGPGNSLSNLIAKPRVSKKQAKEAVHPQRLGTNHFSMDISKTYHIDFGLHSAGFDAFMTGYVFAVCLAQLGRRLQHDGRVLFANCEGFVGRVHVTGKMETYCFSQSAHVKFSAKHAQKIVRLRERSTSSTKFPENLNGQSVAKSTCL